MRTTLAGLALLILSAVPARAFVCLKSASGNCLRWEQSQATLLSFLGGPVQLANGTTSWDQNAINAANDWNAAGAAFRFTVTVGGQLNEPCGPRGPNHACPNTGPAGDNPIVFRSSVCGMPFGPDIIELTNNCWDANGLMINAPVFVNVNVPWNAYDGPIQFNGDQAVNDLRRVLLHEFGHVLGLDHPDANGQRVAAIMNSQESNIDRLQPDDIAGIRSIYPSAPVSVGGGGCAIGTSANARAWWGILPLLLPMLRRCRHREEKRMPVA
ncbi:MAG: matrixin family metalloprotease [Candidatus Binatia bacterium]